MNLMDCQIDFNYPELLKGTFYALNFKYVTSQIQSGYILGL